MTGENTIGCRWAIAREIRSTGVAGVPEGVIPRNADTPTRPNADTFSRCADTFLPAHLFEQYFDGTGERCLRGAGRADHSCCRDCLGIPVAHCDSHSGPCQHLEIVFSVPKR